MILSSDELEVIEYLKSWKGNYVSMVEVCRCAGGRKKFKENPHWAKHLMSRLVDERLIEVNERGHYRFTPEGSSAKVVDKSFAPKKDTLIVGDNYFPPEENSLIVGDNYFSPPEPLPEKPERWISPHIESILKKAGKKIGKAKQSH